jgi:predicted ATPase
MAGAARLTLTDAEAPAVARICRRLDGIALAIELAAGRVDAYGVRGTASLLERRIELLWYGRRTALARHQTLSASLGWSYDRLSDVERKVLLALAIFVGPFTLEAAAGVVSDVDADRTVDLVGRLVDKSLIAAEPADDDGLRYRLLHTVRGYLLAQRDEAGRQLHSSSQG